MRKIFAPVVMCLLSVAFLNEVYGQECSEQALRSSGLFRFRQQGEIFEIPIRVAGCDAVSLELRWSNGRNNGSNFSVTFFDGDNQTIYTKELNGFLSGNYHFPFNTFEPQPWHGADRSNAMFSVPVMVTIQAVRPFAFPASVSYSVVRVASRLKSRGSTEVEEVVNKGAKPTARLGIQGNEVVGIRSAMRLIGSSRVPLVLIELRTSRPFPIRDVPLQMRIGKQTFVNELSGDYTGRSLTLSLTPAMFEELEDGAEIVAFFKSAEPNADTWQFGKLDKKVISDK